MLNDPTIEVLSAQKSISGSCQNLDHAIGHLEYGHVEGPSSEIVDNDFLFGVPAHPIGERRRRRFVDNSQYVEPRNPTRIPGRLPLGVVEIGRNGDHSRFDALPEIGFSDPFHLPQDDPRNLCTSISTIYDFDP